MESTTLNKILKKRINNTKIIIIIKKTKFKNERVWVIKNVLMKMNLSAYSIPYSYFVLECSFLSGTRSDVSK